MPSNLEIKFRVPDLDAIEQRTAALADEGPQLLVQEDVYFAAAGGRLKLRKFSSGAAELIAYRRADLDSVRESQWFASPTSDPDGLQAVLAMTVGQSVTVSKRRTLYWIGQTRVHLDRVEQLGAFVELEVVLDAGQSITDGDRVANSIIGQLGLEDAERISVGYRELLLAKP